MTKKKLTPVKCQKCGKEWTPRKADPARCPSCQSTSWNVPAEPTEVQAADPTPPVLPPVLDPPVPKLTLVEQLEFDPECAYKGLRARFKRKPKAEPADEVDEGPKLKFSEKRPELFDWASSILPKSHLLLLLVILMYSAVTSMAIGNFMFALDWYQATWILPRIVNIFLYPGGPSAWFELYWPLALIIVMLLMTVAFVIWSLPYRFCFKDYVIIRGNVKVKDGRVMWSTDNMWTRMWDRAYGTPPRNKVELWLKHRFFWNPLMPNKGLVKLTLDREIEKPELDGPFTLIAFERRYRMFVALDEMVTTDDGQQSRLIPLDQANENFNDRGKMLVKDTQKFSLANPRVRLEKLRQGTHIVPQELREAADVARRERNEG